MSDSIEQLREECKQRKITQKDIAKKLGVSPVTCQRMLSGDSAKLMDAIYYSNCITELIGLFPFQLLSTPIQGNPKLKLIDIITKLSDEQTNNLLSLLSRIHESSDKVNFSALDWAEAHLLISRMYHKIIKVNLTDDSFEPIEVYSKEWISESKTNHGYKLSDWIEHFIESDAVHPDHKQIFREYANIPCLKNIMRLTDIDCTLEYLRLIGAEYRWVSMEVMRSTEYTLENQVILICIKDIQNDHHF